MGNGEDPANNLYWGALYGVKNYFKRNKEWAFIKSSTSDKGAIAERCLFKHKTSGTYMIADAYRGTFIKKCITDFAIAASGNNKRKLRYNGINLGLNGAAGLCVYTGHNGLMEFNIKWPRSNENVKGNDAIVLACKSYQYFSKPLLNTGAIPILTTTQFMAPEAYAIEAAVNEWISGKTPMQIHSKASAAYSKYQKCSLKAAKRLLKAQN